MAALLSTLFLALLSLTAAKPVVLGRRALTDDDAAAASSRGSYSLQHGEQMQHEADAMIDADDDFPLATEVTRRQLLAQKPSQAEHNKYRAMHQAPNLAWSSSLASSAAKAAQEMVNSCSFQHSGTAGVGENLAAGYSSWADVVAAWYNEVSQYDFNNPGWNANAAHFTQVVWKSTANVGCATKTSGSGCSMGKVFVCHYKNPGNVEGQYKQNVLRKK